VGVTKSKSTQETATQPGWIGWVQLCSPLN